MGKRGRPRRGSHLWTDSCAVLDISSLPRPHPQPDPNDPFLSFTEGGGASVDVTVTATWPDRRETEATVSLVTTKANYGGVRYWYECPACGRRCGKLYAIDRDRRFICRKCRGACYYSQYRKGWMDRFCHLTGVQIC